MEKSLIAEFDTLIMNFMPTFKKFQTQEKEFEEICGMLKLKKKPYLNHSTYL